MSGKRLKHRIRIKDQPQHDEMREIKNVQPVHAWEGNAEVAPVMEHWIARTNKPSKQHEKETDAGNRIEN
jgi:hypothetical protein